MDRLFIASFLSALSALAGTVGSAFISSENVDHPRPAAVHPDLVRGEHEPRPRVINVKEVIISVPRPKVRTWECSGWKDSQVGGRYIECGWK